MTTESLGLRTVLTGGHADMVTAIATPIDNSNMIVSSSRDKSILVWSITNDDTYAVPHRRLTGHGHFVQDVVLSSDGQFALSGSWDGELRLWDLNTGVTTRRFVGHTKDVLSVAFSIDNRQIVSASRDRTIKLWNTLGECKFTIENQDGHGHNDWVSCVRFSPNLQQPTIVSASWDKTVKVWNLTNCKLRCTLAGHMGYVNTVAVSPDGSLCASGGKDGVTLLWDLAEGKRLYSLDAGAIIHALCFSPNRYWLCAGTQESIVIWDLESKSIVQELKPDGPAPRKSNVISKKDQEQYWYHKDEPYSYVSVDQFSKMFEACGVGKKLGDELSEPYDKSLGHKSSLSFSIYSLTKWELLKACVKREYLLMKRNSFIYVFKSTQLVIIAFVTMTVFLRTRMKVNLIDANYFLGSLFFTLTILVTDGFPELSITVSRLPVFYKQRDLYLYPAWAYTIPAAILKIPLSLLESVVWTILTYYVVGYTPEFGRFIRHFLILFALHLMSTSLFLFLAALFQSSVISITAASMPGWLQWGFWISPITYGEIGLTINEFLAPRWNTVISANMTIGEQTLKTRGFNFSDCYYWISLAALFCFAVLFNVGFTLALAFSKAHGMSRAIISHEKFSQLQGKEDFTSDIHVKEKRSKISGDPKKGGMVLPFVPLTLAFQNVQYSIDTPVNKLQLLHDVTGTFTPGVLTALMGVSGVGKTTLLDVLSGRKTGGTIEGNIRIGGYPKVQETFARISGYCEQTDIHSPQITVEESVIYSAWLRLPPSIDSNTKSA